MHLVKLSKKKVVFIINMKKFITSNIRHLLAKKKIITLVHTEQFLNFQLFAIKKSPIVWAHVDSPKPYEKTKLEATQISTNWSLKGHKTLF